MKLSAILAPLVAAKVPHEVILETVRAYEAQQEDALEKRREADRERQARKRGNDRVSRDVTLRHSDRSLVTRAEDSSSNKQITGQEEKKDTAPAALSDLQGFKSELSELDAERVEAIVKHRRAKKAQLTAHSARLFKADAEKAGLSLAAAVDTCISRNWITVKADWLQSHSLTEYELRQEIDEWKSAGLKLDIVNA